MKLPLRETYLMKIPYFDFLFSSRFEGFSKDFVSYFNQILTTDPDENLLSFLELSEYLEDATHKIIAYNLGLFYYRYQKNFWLKKPTTAYKFLLWEACYKDTMPAFNEKYRAKLMVNPEWDKSTENYSGFFITEPDYHQYIIAGLEMMFLDKIIPTNLLPAFTLSILIVYYDSIKEIADFLQINDPTSKII